MSVYAFLAGYILFLWILTKNGKLSGSMEIRQNKYFFDLFLVASFFAIFLLSSLRGESVGVDTKSYLEYYDIAKNMTWIGLLRGEWFHKYYSVEVGFMILEKICADFLVPAQMFLAICAGIYLFGICKFVSEYAENYLISVFSFLAVGSYLMSLNVMRQAVGIGIGCYAITKFKKNKRKFIGLVLLACTFHVSCIVYFAFLLFEWINPTKKKILVAAVLSGAFGFFGTGLLQLILAYFPTYARRYGKGIWKINSAHGIIVVWVIIAVIAFFLAIKTDWKVNKNHFIFDLILMALCYLGVNILGLSFDGLQRLSVPFEPFLILIFDKSCDFWNGKTKSIYILGLVLCMIMLFVRASSTAQYAYLPFWA